MKMQIKKMVLHREEIPVFLLSLVHDSWDIPDKHIWGIFLSLKRRH